MREIKFRGQRLDRGEWVYGYLMEMPKGRLCIGAWQPIGGEATVKDELFFSYKEVDPSTVGQSTGLHDKNGTEIWEGDILKEVAPRGNVYQVLGVPGGFAINTFQDERQQIRTFCEALANDQNRSYVQTQCGVIGNIHQNPELLVPAQQGVKA